MRFHLVLAYLGTTFHGWQRQPDTRTVQGELEGCLRHMTDDHAITVTGAGRTDAGVHAAGQSAHVDLPGEIPPDRLMTGVNRLLPDAVRVLRARRVRATFHARRDARAKHYAYRMSWRPPRLPWTGLRTAVVPPPTSPDHLLDALSRLPGRHDMASFSVPEPGPGTSERTLLRAWPVRRAGGLELHFLGDGFLRYQVRRMVGALLEVGWGRRTPAAFVALLDSPRPGSRLWTAPARGLTLEQVYYRRPVLPGA
jgi:tRNA pseudouridine38-40 synthase